MSNNTHNSIKQRPPIVVVLGHVDHGKTSLLDTIRKTKVAEKESGGITQHIGAYQAEARDRLITFLDTPGHEAFTAIRSRGARVADIAILVVAADEGVKPQTKEAIKIIKEAGIHMIVAINKIDKPGANPDKIKQELAAEDVLLESWGGKIPSVEISAKQNKNIDELLDMVILVADLEDLKEDLSLPSRGVIIESNLDKRRGYVATALIQKGKLKSGEWIVAGNVIGKIKSMDDFAGAAVAEGLPSQPVSITGWKSAPAIGKEFISVSSGDEAETMAGKNPEHQALFRNNFSSEKKNFRVIFKSDVSSSLEAIEAALGAIKSDEVGYQVISYDIGNISEGDVKMAIGSKAHIVGFRIDIDNAVKKHAEKENVKVVVFNIIYELIEYVRKQMGELLEPQINRIFVGKLKILAVFKKDSKTQIVGGKVTSGKISRGSLADVIRNSNKLLSGKITQLQHNKEDIQDVKEGLECGLRFEPLPDQPSWDIKEGDILEIYQEEKITRSL